MKKIIIASNNNGKISELKKLLEPLNIEVLSQKEAGTNIDIEENGSTYSENATLKATAIFNLKNIPVIADDSGLEIEFLSGKPGIYTARFLGKDTPYQDKHKKILEMLKNAKDDERTARFICAICYIDENGEQHIFEETCEGKIAYEPKGINGFGYDPIFEYNGKVFAEMSNIEKNKISHRGKALKSLVNFLKFSCNL